MKFFTAFITRLLLLLLTISAPLLAQDGDSISAFPEPTGFGLQSSIFRYVQNTSVDLERNLSDAEQYTMTPGDIFQLTMSYGVSLSRADERSVVYELQLSENYTLDIPVLGEISVKNRDLLTLRSFVAAELKKAIPLQHVSLFLSQPAQFNIFVYGNVNRPGFLTVSPLLRVIDAIALSSGFKTDGSYRHIRFERRDETIELDISRFYSDADFDANPVLQPGDVIFVPVAQRVTALQGDIRYPGKYELVGTDTLSDVLTAAGGFLPAAERASVDLIRQNESNRPLTIRVKDNEYDTFEMVNGDIVRIRSRADNSLRVAVEGAIWGKRVSATETVTVPSRSLRVDLPYYDSMSLLDVLEEVGGPTPFMEEASAFIIRGESELRLPAHVKQLWETRDAKFDVVLEPGDSIVVPIQTSGVFVTGAVIRPGKVGYESGYTVNDYVLLAGGYDPRKANTLALYTVDDGGKRTSVRRNDVVPRGRTIFVGRNPLYFVDDTMQGILLGAAWVTSLITIATGVLQFIDTFIVDIYQ